MVFTEDEIIAAFKAFTENNGWVYFVGVPESNAKIIIDYMKEHKESVNEEELDNLALENVPNYCYVSDNEYLKDTWIDGFKTCYRKVK